MFIQGTHSLINILRWELVVLATSPTLVPLHKNITIKVNGARLLRVQVNAVNEFDCLVIKENIMPTCAMDRPEGYYQDLKLRRNSYRDKLIAKGVINDSNKMRTLMHRKGL